jgi:hypothetical protein
MKRHVGDMAVTWLLEDMARMTTSGNGLTNRQSKYQNMFKGLMAPSGEALNHPAAPLLLELATLGCPAEVGEGWSMEMLEAAIEKGSHPSAMEPEAAGKHWKRWHRDTPDSLHGPNSNETRLAT